MIDSTCSISAAPARLLARVTACLIVTLWPLLEQPVIAETRSHLSAPLLLPQSDPESFQLIGLYHAVTFHVTGAETYASGIQRYVIRSLDSEPAEATFTLAAEAPLQSLTVTQDDVTTTMDPLDPTILDATLTTGESTEIIVAYETSEVEGSLLSWMWDLSSLERWGQVPTMRVTLGYPQTITDEVLWDASPPNDSLVGNKAIWDLDSTVVVEAIVLAPAVWHVLTQARAADDYAQLAQIYRMLGSDAAELDIPDHTIYAATVAALEAAIERTPDSIEPRTALAEIYMARSQALPDLQLLYLSLALEQLHSISPTQRTLAIQQRLGELHLRAAFAAETEHPSLALEHLRQADELLEEDVMDHREESLTLRLALSLAEEGLLDQALDTLHDRISPQTQDALLRYAPPFASVVTTITMTQETRTAEQCFQLYPPKAEATLRALAMLAKDLDAQPHVRAHLALNGSNATLIINVDWSSLTHLRELSRNIADRLDQDQLLPAVIASPWIEPPETYTRTETLWETSVRYQERVDLRHLRLLWENDQSLAEWQAVEIEATLRPSNEPTFEQQLAHHALTQQRDIWRALPRSSYWMVHVATDGNSAPQAIGRVAFGETGEISATSTRHHHERIALAAIAGLVLAAIVSTLVAYNRSATNGSHAP